MTLSCVAYERLRAELLSGKLRPGAKLRIDHLSRLYGVGASPMREALSRLSESGLVISEAQRGYRVAPISLDDFRDVIETRLLLELDAIACSIRNGDLAWEARLVAAHHRLAQVQKHSGRSDRKAREQWAFHNRAFHLALISACGSAWMVRFCLMLYDQMRRYQQAPPARERIPMDPVRCEHEALLNAALERDIVSARRILERHVRNAAAVRVERGLPRRLGSAEPQSSRSSDWAGNLNQPTFSELE